MIESQFNAFGSDCAITTNVCWRCGYILFPTSSPFWGKKDISMVGCHIHGGVTFADRWERISKEPSDLWAIGFDCLHYNDAPDFSIEPNTPEGRSAKMAFEKHQEYYSGYEHVWTAKDVRDHLTEIAQAICQYSAELSYQGGAI